MNNKIKSTRQRRLITIKLIGKHPIESVHSFSSLEAVDRFLQMRCRAMWPETIRFYAFHILWEGLELRGNIVIDSDNKEQNDIFGRYIQLQLEDTLLLCASDPDQYLEMVQQPQWQMDRLFLDPEEQKQAYRIITTGEGLNHDQFLKLDALLAQAISKNDQAHPLILEIQKQGKPVIQQIRNLSGCKSDFIPKSILLLKQAILPAINSAFHNQTEPFGVALEDFLRTGAALQTFIHSGTDHNCQNPWNMVAERTI